MGTHKKAQHCFCHETSLYTSLFDKDTTAAANHFLATNKHFFRMSPLNSPLSDKKRKENLTLFSDHNGSLLRRQPGALCQIHSCMIQHSHINLLEA